MAIKLHKDLVGEDLHVNKLHAATHVAAGTDPLVLAESQVTDLTTDLAAKVATTDARLSDARAPTAHTQAEATVIDLVDDLAGKAPTVHAHVKADVTDFPASMPASDVSAWAKGATKPSYTNAEVGAAATVHAHVKADISDFPTVGEGTVTAVTGTSPIVSSEGATPAISLPAATNAAPGHATAAQIAALEAATAAQHAIATIGTGNGLSIAGQAISLAPATASVPGAATAAQITKLDGIAVVKQFTTAMSQANFLTMMADMSIDVIEMQGGTYQDWQIGDGTRFKLSRAARPLLIRPAPGADVVFDGAGITNGDGWFYCGDWTEGGSTITDYITFDPIGTGGTFTIQNYDLDQSGLVNTLWTDHVAFNGFRVRSCTGAAGGSTSWCVYVQSDGTHRGSNLTFNNWDVVGAVDKTLSGFQTYHEPNADGITVKDWVISSAHNAMVGYDDATGIIFDGWTVTDCDYPVNTDGVATGIVRNCVGLGNTLAPLIQAPFVDGGGNSWNYALLAPAGATYTPATGAQGVALDVSAGNMHVVSGHAVGTAITFTISGATNNQPFVVSILQGGTTVSTIAAWFATIRWAGGTAPTLTATVNKRDTFGFIRTGANTYDGFVIGQNA